MIKEYLIDGNNLIWQIPELKNLQKDASKREHARERLVFVLQRYFAGKKIKVTVFFDGAPHTRFGGNIRLKFSYERTADELIRKAIDKLKTKHAAAVVSSDRWISDYAKVNGCKTIRSSEFAKMISSQSKKSNEEEIMRELRNYDWEDIFGEE